MRYTTLHLLIFVNFSWTCLGTINPFKESDVEYFYQQAKPEVSIDHVFDDQASVWKDSESNSFSPGLNEKRVTKKLTEVVAKINEHKINPLSKSEPLIQQRSGKSIVSSLANKEICQILAYLNAKAYGNTKRLSKDQYVFNEDLYGVGGGDTSAASQWLSKQGIIAKKPFVGLHGAGENKELDYPGFVAYRIYEKAGGWKHVDIFVTFRGSQGEGFQALGGLAGASWLTNLDADKLNCNGSELGISNKYFTSNSDRQLSLHQGYARKFMSFKSSLSSHLMELFQKDLTLVSYNTLSDNFSDEDKYLEGTALRSHVDDKRKCTFQVYCTGHSQGGGIAQISAAFLTTYIGEYLYGPNFDNKVFNLVYGVFLSPARAWGSEHTRIAYENVVGVNNMVGYSTVMDVVTSMPLGHNIEKDKGKAAIFEIGKLVLRGIAKLFGDPYVDLAKLVCNSKNSYETLTHWAFEDPVDIFSKYCRLNVEAIDTFVKDAKAGKIVVDDEAKYTKSLLEEKKNFESFVNNAKNVGNLDTFIKETQEEYFYAHREGGWFSTIKRDYHILRAVKSLNKAIKMCVSPVHFIASQHFGVYSYNRFLDKNELIKTNLGQYFSVRLLSFDLQECVERADAYYEKKNRMVK
ncbi:MAG: hypothetical protein LBD69_03940 [Puniceicoccales bacterium]|nr:hypothetical protein [Puniceicoccales bacterium]